MRRLKIGFLTHKDPHNAIAWSGTIHRMYRALAEHAGEVEIIGERPRPLWLGAFWYYLNLLRRTFGQRAGVMQSIPLSWAFGWFFSRKLAESDCDVVFAPIGACEVAYLRTDKPIVYYSDSTFASLFGYHFKPSEVSSLGQWEAAYLDRRMAHRVDALVYASDWAAHNALNDLGADPAKVHIVPMGANFAQAPSRDALLQGSTDGRCRLLFVGRYWERKGGAIAVDTLHALVAMGVDAVLTIVGCVPSPPISGDRVQVIPSLRADIPEQAQQLQELFRTSDFFLMPTRAECFGIVFCEASAYGLPSVATYTGGVPSAVRDGVNGILLPLEADGPACAEAILAVWRDPVRYRKLRESSRRRFEEVLNWRAWAESVRHIMEEVIATREQVAAEPPSAWA